MINIRGNRAKTVYFESMPPTHFVIHAERNQADMTTKYVLGHTFSNSMVLPIIHRGIFETIPPVTYCACDYHTAGIIKIDSEEYDNFQLDFDQDGCVGCLTVGCGENQMVFVPVIKDSHAYIVQEYTDNLYMYDGIESLVRVTDDIQTNTATCDNFDPFTPTISFDEMLAGL